MNFIGISQRLIENESYFELREALSTDWGKLFNENPLFKGFLPLPLSTQLPFEKYASVLSGVILSGGNDLAIFNKSLSSKLRDEYEMRLIKTCKSLNLPLLGVCRGAQIIAHFFKSKLAPCQNHTNLHEIENEAFRVNSFHNYAILNLGNELECIFKSKDNFIEAFKHRQLQIYALMWHIERENGLNELSVLKAWLEAVKKYKGRK